MSITPLPNADFAPTMAGYSGQKPFRFWCQTVLPLVYDDSLSYYELLNKVVNYLNNTIADVASVEDNVAGLLTAYNQLQDYVNDYFSELDVQEEIDLKLDEMASSGALNVLIDPVVAESTTAWLAENVNPVGSAVVVNPSLTVSGAAADAKVVGDTCYRAYKIILSNAELLNESPNGTLGGLPVNKGYVIGASSVDATDEPYNGFVGFICTYSYNDLLKPGCVQVAYSTGNNAYFRSYLYSSGGNYWNSWERVVGMSQHPFVMNGGSLSDGAYASCDELPIGNTFFIPSTITIANKPFDSFAGTIITLSRNGEVGAGALQIAFSTAGQYSNTFGKLYSRIYATSWSRWQGTETDTSLGVAGVAADSKAVGDRAILSSLEHIRTNDTYTSFNDLPFGRVVFIASASGLTDGPISDFAGTVVTFGYSKDSVLRVQLAVCSAGLYETTFSKLYIRIYTNQWYAWQEFTTRENTLLDIGNKAITRYPTMITTAQKLSDLTGGTMSADDFPVNKVIVHGVVASTTGLINGAYVGGSSVGSYLTTNIVNNNGNGATQIFVGTSGMASRWKVGGHWTTWKVYEVAPEEYRVGPTRTNTSLSALLQSLASNTNKKTVYIDPGVYDIFKEYRDLNMPSPPDDVSNSDYLTRVISVPANTKIVGIGNVTLRWDPDATVAENPSISPITYGEARVWAPLNVFRAAEIENIEIICHKGRYCIHDDSHNNSADIGVSHIYRNVRCYYKAVSDGYGFNNVIGFGFSSKNKYLFENCVFEMLDSDHTAFYGHGASASSLLEGNSPNIIVNNCVIIGGPTTAGNAIRLQNLTTAQLRIITTFVGCYIKGKVVLTNQESGDKQGFDVTLLNSGEHEFTYYGSTTNIYPGKVYS